MDWRFLIGSVSLSLLRLRKGCHIANYIFSADMKEKRKKGRTQSGGNVIFSSRLIKSTFSLRLTQAACILVLFNCLLGLLLDSDLERF